MGTWYGGRGPRYRPRMIFEEIRTGGCCSYVIACGETCAGVVVDAELSQIDRTLALIGKAGVRVHYVVDTHTHADHFSASHELARRLGVPRVMHRSTSTSGSTTARRSLRVGYGCAPSPPRVIPTTPCRSCSPTAC